MTRIVLVLNSRIRIFLVLNSSNVFQYEALPLPVKSLECDTEKPSVEEDPPAIKTSPEVIGSKSKVSLVVSIHL